MAGQGQDERPVLWWGPHHRSGLSPEVPRALAGWIARLYAVRDQVLTRLVSQRTYYFGIVASPPPSSYKRIYFVHSFVAPHPPNPRLRRTGSHVLSAEAKTRRMSGPCFWRRDRDSNPGYGFPHTRFPSVLLQPLGHLSMCPEYCTITLGCLPAVVYDDRVTRCSMMRFNENLIFMA